MVVMYGAPNMPTDGPPTRPPVQPWVVPDLSGRTPPSPPGAGSKRRLRICTMLDPEGGLRLKVYVDGCLLCESTGSGGGDLTLETEI
jgi:hypothetical protein